MVCKKNTSDLYWFGPKNALCPVGEESLVLSCTEVLIVGVTKRVREGGTSRSQDVSGEWVSMCVPMDLPFVYSSSLLFFSLEWSLPSPFIDARRTQGYMYVLRDIFLGKEDLMPPLSPCSR
jgi:hypothetical protein